MRSHRSTLILTASAALLLGAASCSDDDTTGADTSDVDITSGVTDADSTTDATDTADATDTTDTTDATDTTDVGDRLATARAALSDGDFSTMLQALSLSSLGDELEGRAVTILAPTNDAFTQLSADDLTNLLADPTEIDDVLKRHIIDEALTFDELSARDSVTTLSGETLAVVTTGSTVTVDGAVVTPPANDAVSGEEGEEIVVFGIDRVLLAA